MVDFFIDGVGDEVVLFGGFLVFSLVFLIAAALWQGRRGEPGRERDTTRQEEPPRPSQAAGNNQTERDYTENRTELDGLRHRSSSRDTSNIDPSPRSEELRQDVAIEEGVADGHGPEDVGMTIRLVRAGMPGHPLEVHVTPSSTIDQLRQTHFSEELSQQCPVRFIYQGRLIIDDNTTIGSLNIRDGGAMHVHVGRPRPQGEPPPPPHPQQLDLSHLFLPLIGVMLGIVWVVMLSYPYVFSFVTKVFLFALSFGYVVLAYYSTYGN